MSVYRIQRAEELLRVGRRLSDDDFVVTRADGAPLRPHSIGPAVGPTRSPRAEISQELSARIDSYLERFRSHIPGADTHTGLWPSKQNCPKCPDAIYIVVLKRTKKSFGFGVNIVFGTPRRATRVGRARKALAVCLRCPSSRSLAIARAAFQGASYPQIVNLRSSLARILPTKSRGCALGLQGAFVF